MQKNKQSFLILIMIQLCTVFCSDVSYSEFINNSSADYWGPRQQGESEGSLT